MSVRRLRRATPALAGVLLYVALFISGCTTPPQLAQLEQQWPAQLPDRVLLEHVPFHPQDDKLCGPATLAMVAQAAGRSVTPEELVSQVYLPGRQGALQLEMLAAARRQGLVAYPLEPTLKALLTEVASGHPVLVLQNLALPFSPMWHYAVVVGFDRDRREILLHSGTTARQGMPLSIFEHTWARSDHWAFRASLPSQLPVTAQPGTWASAVASLERVDVLAAEVAYTTALVAWPAHRISLFGLGNTAYAQGRREDAARAFEATIEAHPDFADAWNNLAQVLLDLGRFDAAHQAALKAVALGGPRLQGYLALLEKIVAKSP